MHLSGEELVHRCHHVSVQKDDVLLRVVGSAFITDAVPVTGMMHVHGNVQVRGFMLDEHGPLRSSAGLCVAQGGWCSAAASLVLGLSVGHRQYPEGKLPQGTGPHPGHPLATRGVLLNAMEVHQGG